MQRAAGLEAQNVRFCTPPESRDSDFGISVVLVEFQ